jgi:hypothetical protein
MKNWLENKLSLRFIILVLVVVALLISQIIAFYYLQKPIHTIFLDSISGIITAICIVEISLYLIEKKEKQLRDQIEQLTDAYQYIGQINRKIDALLEVDISTLDHSKHLPPNESSSAIFKQLINLLQAKAGYLYLKPPIKFKIFHGSEMENGIKKIFENLRDIGIKEFKHSQGKANEQFFIDLGVNEVILKKYTILVKPVYMHEKEMGTLILLFKKGQTLEDRDLNIVRIYSFYLALNYTFKPDLSSYQA